MEERLSYIPVGRIFSKDESEIILKYLGDKERETLCFHILGKVVRIGDNILVDHEASTILQLCSAIAAPINLDGDIYIIAKDIGLIYCGKIVAIWG